MIGIIRHKGFISWDDDLDTHMLREDYQNLLRAMEDKPDDRRLDKFRMLTENLNDCIEVLNISPERNHYYFLNVTKELVYPSLIYFRKMDVPYSEIYGYIKQKCDSYRMQSPSIFQLVISDLKWGTFAAIYKMGWYRVMYNLIGFNKE